MTCHTAARAAACAVDRPGRDHLAGRARADRRPRRDRRARPDQRRHPAGRRAGDRRRAAPRPGRTDSVQAADELLAVAGGVRRPRSATPAPDGDRQVTVSGADGVRGADVDLHAVSELTPVAAALAAVAIRAQPDPRRRRTSAATRPTGWPRSRAELTGLGVERAADRRRAGDHARAAATAARSTPTPTTGWPTPARCSAWSRPASSSTTSAAPPRRCRTSPACGRACWGRSVSRRAGESITDDPHAGFGRPGKRSRPRTKDRPDYPNAVDGHGRHGRPRPLPLPARRRRRRGDRHEGPHAGPHGRDRRRPGAAGRRHLRRRGHAGPDRRGDRARDRAAPHRRRRRPVRAADRRQRRPAGDRDRAGRPAAAGRA